MKLKLFVLILIYSTSFISAQTQIGNDIDGVFPGDKAGEALSISADGNRVAVGSPRNDDGGDNAGHVRVFENVGGSWTLLGSTIEGDAGLRMGQAVSLSADGNRLVVGGLSFDFGIVRIYDYSDGNWNQVGVDLIGEAAGDQFGHFLAISSDGKRIVIAASLANTGGLDLSGKVRVYKFNNIEWVQLGNGLVGTSALDFFGQSVAINEDGSRVAIGAPGNDDAADNAGHIRLFEFSGSNWVQMGNTIKGGSSDHNVGHSVALSADGSRVLAGSLVNADPYVRTFDFDGISWNQAGNNIKGEAAGDSFGFSVSITADGNRVAVGARRNDGGGEDAGHVRIFDYIDGMWVKTVADIDGEAAGDRSGEVIALSADGGRIVIGAARNDGGGEDAGHARVYQLQLLPVNSIAAQQDMHICVFPNPSTGYINIKGFESLEKDIQIANASGKIIASFRQKEPYLDLSHLETGLYFISIAVEGQSVVCKLLLN